jgi:hypothetical protein
MTPEPTRDTKKTLIEKPLSYSQIETFLTCRYRWFLQYVLGIRPRVRSRPLEIGDAVHRGIAEFMSGRDPDIGIDAWYADLLRSLVVDDEGLNLQAHEMYLTAKAVTARAIAGLFELGYWTHTDVDGNPFVERELLLPVVGWPGGFQTKLDLIAVEPSTSAKWVIDFKTRGGYFTDENDEDASLQNAIYHAAALLNGIDVEGTITFQIKSTPPKRPKLNKPKADGTVEMSRAAVACDWQTYEAALVEAGLDPADYQEMRTKLDSVEFVKPVFNRRSHQTIENIWNAVVEPAAYSMAGMYRQYLEMGLPGERRNMHRHLSPRVCNGCGVQKVCFGDLKGYDVPGILALEFEHDHRALARFRG